MLVPWPLSSLQMWHNRTAAVEEEAAIVAMSVAANCNPGRPLPTGRPAATCTHSGTVLLVLEVVLLSTLWYLTRTLTDSLRSVAPITWVRWASRSRVQLLSGSRVDKYNFDFRHRLISTVVKLHTHLSFTPHYSNSPHKWSEPAQITQKQAKIGPKCEVR